MEKFEFLNFNSASLCINSLLPDSNSCFILFIISFIHFSRYTCKLIVEPSLLLTNHCRWDSWSLCIYQCVKFAGNFRWWSWLLVVHSCWGMELNSFVYSLLSQFSLWQQTYLPDCKGKPMVKPESLVSPVSMTGSRMGMWPSQSNMSHSQYYLQWELVGKILFLCLIMNTYGVNPNAF